MTKLAWRHPEWWVLLLCAGAWALMLRQHAVHGTHAHGSALQNWLLMTLAMMLPLVLGPIRVAAQRSLWRRRHRAILAFLAGYLGCWMLVGIAVSFAQPAPLIVVGVAFAAAGVWQLTPWKRVALTGCHRTMPLAPHGWRADRDCIRFGWQIGLRCVVSCWALMLACALSSHALPATIAATALVWIERYGWRRGWDQLSNSWPRSWRSSSGGVTILR